MANSYGITSAECRLEAKNMSTNYYSDINVDNRVTLRESTTHKDIGRTSAYVLADDPTNYNLIKLAIIKITAADMLSTVDIYKEDAKQKMDEYKEMIEQLVDHASFTFYGAGHNITEELDRDNYIHNRLTTAPNLGIN